MKKLILYTCGGLSNRIFPLISCIQYAKDTNRKLFVYWPIDRVVPALFTELYDEKINIVDEHFLNSLDDYKTDYYSKFIETVYNDYNVYGRTFLNNKLNEGKLKTGLNFSDTENIVLTTNNFLPQITEKQNIKLLRELKLYDIHVNAIDNHTKKLNLSKDVLGIHFRGTDLHKGLDYYVDKIKNLLEENKKIFICSDDEDLELNIYNMYPDQIIYRKNKKYVTKYNPEQTTWNGWGNNTYMKDIYTMNDAIYDLYLLAKTTLKFYNTNSTYSVYAKILSEKGE